MLVPNPSPQLHHQILTQWKFSSRVSTRKHEHASCDPPSTAGKHTWLGELTYSAGRLHPADRFLSTMDPNHSDIKPRKGEATSTDVPHSLSDHHKELAYRCLFVQESGVNCWREAGEGFNQDNTWKVWSCTKFLIINHCTKKTHSSTVYIPVPIL